MQCAYSLSQNDEIYYFNCGLCLALGLSTLVQLIFALVELCQGKPKGKDTRMVRCPPEPEYNALYRVQPGEVALVEATPGKPNRSEMKT